MHFNACALTHGHLIVHTWFAFAHCRRYAHTCTHLIEKLWEPEEKKCERKSEKKLAAVSPTFKYITTTINKTETRTNLFVLLANKTRNVLCQFAKLKRQMREKLQGYVVSEKMNGNDSGWFARSAVPCGSNKPN